MQRKLKHAAWILVANASLWVMACATAVQPDVGGPNAEGYNPVGGDGSSTGGSGGDVASPVAGSTANGGKAAAGEGGTASGGAGGKGASGGNAGTGAKGGTGGSGNGAGGKGGTGNGGTGAGGMGATGSGGKGGTGGSGNVGGAVGGIGGSGANGGSGGSGSGVNLITNSGFETNTTGWSVFGGSATIASTSAEAHSGTQSLVITGRTQTYQGPQYSVLSVATPGTSYTMSLWGKLPSNATGSLIVTLHYTCSGGSSAGENYFTWVPSSAASASSWTQFSGAQTFPACAGGGTMSAASFYVESPSATLSYYLDDVVFTTP